MDNELLIKLVVGICSKEEKHEILELLERDENMRNEYADLKNVYALSRSNSIISEEDFSDGYITIRKKINRLRFRSFLRYAAVLFFVFCLGGVLNWLMIPAKSVAIAHNDGIKTTIIVPLGQNAEIVLPDSSRVLMNSGSTLSYTTAFTPLNRNVELNGEAFFDVKKDSLHPFTVKTSSVKIKVYGTAFNLDAYNDKSLDINTTLISGKVEIENLKDKKLAELTPGIMACYNRTKNTLSLSKVNINLYTSWKKGILTFNDVQLEAITNKMERWYNVEIIYLNPKLKNLRYSGAILKNKPIDQILEVMKITSNIQYKIDFRSNKPSIIYLK